MKTLARCANYKRNVVLPQASMQPRLSYIDSQPSCPTSFEVLWSLMELKHPRAFYVIELTRGFSFPVNALTGWENNKTQAALCARQSHFSGPIKTTPWLFISRSQSCKCALFDKPLKRTNESITADIVLTSSPLSTGLNWAPSCRRHPAAAEGKNMSRAHDTVNNSTNTSLFCQAGGNVPAGPPHLS